MYVCESQQGQIRSCRYDAHGSKGGFGGDFPVLKISEAGVSKIYLEQVFSLLKRDGLVNSIKGAQGGYQLSRPAEEISVYDILSVAELSMFEKQRNRSKKGS